MSKKKTGKTEFVRWFGPILDSLRALSGSAKPKEIMRWIGEQHNIPDEVLNERYEKTGLLRFQNQLAWARQYLVWEELLSASKYGVWALTSKGWETHLNEHQANEIFYKWVKVFQNLRKDKTSETVDAEAEKIIKIQEEADPDLSKNKLKPTLIEILQNLSPPAFEQLCGRLLREYDFENVEFSPSTSQDGGIDGLATLKLNPFVNINVFFQCKRFADVVPIDKIHAFMLLMDAQPRNIEKGVFITTGSFPKAALEIERNNPRLDLIDGDQLVEMFEKVELGVSPRIVFEPDLPFFEQYLGKTRPT